MGQIWQSKFWLSVRILSVRIRPGGHESQLALPEPELDLPMGHVTQLTFILVSSFATGACFPCGQDLHAVV